MSTRPTSSHSPSPPTGSLLPVSATPATGERIETIFEHGNVVVEQILSGRDVAPEAYLQDDDEWVVILGGAATLDLDGRRLDLGAGDWAFLPAHVPHALIETAAGTNWLTVRLRPA